MHASADAFCMQLHRLHAVYTCLIVYVCLQLLVEKGADVNRPFTAESLPAVPFKHLVTQCPTPLHLACDRGDIELVKVGHASV